MVAIGCMRWGITAFLWWALWICICVCKEVSTCNIWLITVTSLFFLLDTYNKIPSRPKFNIYVTQENSKEMFSQCRYSTLIPAHSCINKSHCQIFYGSTSEGMMIAWSLARLLFLLQPHSFMTSKQISAILCCRNWNDHQKCRFVCVRRRCWVRV